MDHLGAEYLGPYDFTLATSLSLESRFERSVEQVRAIHVKTRYAEYCELPPVPPIGASESELKALEEEVGVSLPAEYKAFRRRWRYLLLGDGFSVWGLDYQGISIGKPWVSEEHSVPGKYLVFGYLWQFADGDQLMFKLDDPDIPVVAYLHEHGPVAEFF